MVKRRWSGPAIAAVCALVVATAGCRSIEVSGTEEVVAPDPGATEFASAFGMDESRIVARAVLDDAPVVYVFDRDGSGWIHSATITAPSGSSSGWGRHLAVSGDTVVIADPLRPGAETEQYGWVSVFDLRGGSWTRVQVLLLDEEFTSFAAGVWLSGDGLVVKADQLCDLFCSNGRWRLYQRYEGRFRQVFDSAPERAGVDLDVGSDQGRFVLGNPLDDPPDFGLPHQSLMAWDTTVRLPALLLDETTPYGDAPPPNTGYYRKVDVSADLLAYESCCSTESLLHILRDDGGGYAEEATFPLTKASAWLSALPGAVLLADRDTGSWHTYIEGQDGWQRSVDLPAPDAVAGQFIQPPVAAGNQVAVAGDSVLHVLTIDVVDLAT